MRLIFLCAWLGINAIWLQTATAEPLTPAIFTEDNEGELISVAGADPFMALSTILHLDTKHLTALGLGIIFGATVITTQLEVGEVSGILIGVIAGDLFYRAFLAPTNKHSSSWLPEDLF